MFPSWLKGCVRMTTVGPPLMIIFTTDYFLDQWVAGYRKRLKIVKSAPTQLLRAPSDTFWHVLFDQHPKVKNIKFTLIED